MNLKKMTLMGLLAANMTMCASCSNDPTVTEVKDNYDKNLKELKEGYQGIVGPAAASVESERARENKALGGIRKDHRNGISRVLTY